MTDKTKCPCCGAKVDKLVKTAHGMMCAECAAERKANLDKLNEIRQNAWGGQR